MMEEKIIYDLSQQEIELFELLKNRDERRIKEIIEREEACISQKQAPSIRGNAQDENRDSFFHCAVKGGKINIVLMILNSSINFSYHLLNKEGKTAIQLTYYGDVFTGQILNHDKFQGCYSQTITEIEQQEIKTGGYKEGIIFTSSFSMICKSKKDPIKNCIIEDKEIGHGGSIHDRQAIDEAVLANQAHLKEKKWLPVPPRLQGQNYVFANIGLVIGTKAYEKTKNIPRCFLSVPIYLSSDCGTELDVIHRESTSGHSEVNLYDLLLLEDNLRKVLTYFRAQVSIPNQEVRRIYAGIIDLHSSQDVCDSCEIKGYQFEKDLVKLIKKIASSVYFEVSKTFQVALRASSARQPSHSSYRYSYHHRQNYPNVFNGIVARQNTHTQLMDIRRSESVILHYDEKTRELRGAGWYEEEKIFKSNIKPISPRTEFFVTTNKKPYSNLSLPDKYEIRKIEDFPLLVKKI